MEGMNEDPLLGADSVIVADNINIVEEETLGEDGEKVPEVGMTFDDENEVLDRIDVTSMPERYIIRRWRRDVSRAHTRVAVNYDGLASTPDQLRYDEMCMAFSEVADLAAPNECGSRAILDWIKAKAQELRNSGSSGGSNFLSQRTVHSTTPCTSSHNGDVSVLDPTKSKRKGAPRKLRLKGPLESSSRKRQGTSTSSKTRRARPPRSLVEEAAPIDQFSQQLQCSQPTPMSTSQMGDLESHIYDQHLQSTAVIELGEHCSTFQEI